MTGWDDELDRFEAGLAEQRRTLAEGRPQDLEAFAPRALGALPPDLADRARELSARADALTQELTAAAASAARRLQLVTAMKGSSSPTSSFVDQRG